MTRTPSLHDLRRMGARFLRRGAGPLVLVYGALVAVEIALVAALPGAMGANPLATLWPSAAPWRFGGILDQGPRILVIVLLFMATDLLRTALYAPTRQIVLRGQDLGPRQILGSAAPRMLAVFGAQQVVGLFGFLAWAVCQACGAGFSTTTELLTIFALMPAVYWAARGAGLGRAAVGAIGWSRRHAGWIFGSQTALVCLALWLNAFIDESWAHEGSAAVSAAVSLGICAFFVTYRFAEWALTSTVWMAIEEAESGAGCG